MKLAAWCRRFIALALVVLAPSAMAEPQIVIYPKPESENDSRPEYPFALLKLALGKGTGEFVLRRSSAIMQQGRALVQLTSGDLDVVYAMTSPERERELRPIRIAIDKGLLGWRLLLVNRGDAGRFAAVRTVEDLRGFQAGQGHDWPDVAILRANGLSVVTSTSYEGLFKMLAGRRFDYFPRSIEEIAGELAAHPNLDLEIEPNLVLHYPTAEYFFVAPSNQALADAIEQGLRVAIGDGSFDALFDQVNGPLIRAAGIEKRHTVVLVNPLWPPDAPAAPGFAP